MVFLFPQYQPKLDNGTACGDDVKSIRFLNIGAKVKLYSDQHDRGSGIYMSTYAFTRPARREKMGWLIVSLNASSCDENYV